uniref:PIR2-like helical domain-containing protein n=1 Tax=Arundo donax TaxID=35708 RepID=A0A0A9B882_ARUDO
MQVLLERIHGFYLEAISRIPAPCLRSRHHRGLLKAGHCYGPFDTVTNIIVNTISYDTAFPHSKSLRWT